MSKTIIFLNGFAIPVALAKTKFVWDDLLWKNYNRVYSTSKIPLSDQMVEAELDRLSELISQYDEPIIAGHSLGAWWAANLACSSQFKIKKLVFLTPLGDITNYPIFNISSKFHLPTKCPHKLYHGNDKSLLIQSTMDLIVPSYNHSPAIIDIFNPTIFSLFGGHLFQLNHNEGLSFMKRWIEKE